MKRVLVSVLCALCTLAAGAQSRQASFEAMLPDSVKYVLPAFAEGSLVYKDGGFSKGSFNISALDQTLRYIDTDGSEKAFYDDNVVDRVTIGGVLFIRPQASYLGIVGIWDEVMLCVEKRLKFDDAKRGAYGTVSSTSNIKSIQVVGTGDGSQFHFDGDLRYEIKETPYLYRKGRVYVPTKKLLCKFFPDKKDRIENYLRENKVDFSVYPDVAKLMEGLK